MHRSMRTKKRKSVLVIVDLLNGDLPSRNGVTLCAVRSHFPLVNISMTILTILADVGEYRFGVALRTRHFLMQTPERIFGLIVVEFRNCTDRPPTRRGVAVFAGYSEGTVRATSGDALSGQGRNPGQLPGK